MSEAPWVDPVGPDPRAGSVGDTPLLARARVLARDFDADADHVAADGVTRDRIDRAAAAGLLAPWAPPADGGPGATAAVVRECAELVAGACVSTWFVIAQHRSAWEAASTTSVAELAERWAGPLSDGRALGAVAFAHLRRQGPPTVVAHRDGAGWRVDGRLEWVTGWGLADVLCLMVRSGDDVLVTLLPAVARPGMVASPALDLTAVSATSTVAMTLKGMHVSRDEVALRLPYAEWLRDDALRTANCVPAVFGLTRSLVGWVSRIADERNDEDARAAVARLAERVREIRSEAYALVDERPPDSHVERRIELRAASLRVLSEAADAAVVVSGGRATSPGSRPARWSAEARFFLVQAQTSALRSAWLDGAAR